MINFKDWADKIDNSMLSSGKGGRGFRGMDPDRQKQIASKGGRAAHKKGVAHEFSSEEAKEAGRKGGRAKKNYTEVL